VRKIEKFAFTHIIADFLILITTITICIYNIMKIKNPDPNPKIGGWAPDGVYAINPNTWLNMVGFSVYSYEGIGIILPIMDLTAKPEHYPKILFAVLTTVMVTYVGFG
jgi:proton-coupled amino acid transporter